VSPLVDKKIKAQMESLEINANKKSKQDVQVEKPKIELRQSHNHYMTPNNLVRQKYKLDPISLVNSKNSNIINISFDLSRLNDSFNETKFKNDINDFN